MQNSKQIHTNFDKFDIYIHFTCNIYIGRPRNGAHSLLMTPKQAWS